MQADTFGRGRMKGREVFPTTCKISDFVNCLKLHNVAQANFPLISLLVTLMAKTYHNGDKSKEKTISITLVKV